MTKAKSTILGMCLFLLLVSVGIIGCGTEEEEIAPLEPLQVKLVSFESEAGETALTTKANFDVFNPNETEVTLTTMIHKVTPHPPGFSLWPAVTEYKDLTVPAKGTIRVTEVGSIPKTGLGEQMWPLLTNPETQWVVTGRAAFAREAGDVLFSGTQE